jgi:two-component system phosphate regulon sensor histidine kinase PhoR
MRQGIFRRALLLYTVVLVAAILFIEIYITGIVRDNYINNLKQSLAIQAALASNIIPSEISSISGSICTRIKETTGSRVTLIGIDGRVLCDSERDPSLMDNHSTRPEIAELMYHDTGWAERYSETLKFDLLYTAKKVTRGGKTAGFIRLAIPLKEIDKSINSLRLEILFAVIPVFLLTAILLIWYTGRIKRFVAQITDYSKSLAEGDLDKRLFLKGAEEFDKISRNLNKMASHLKESINMKEEESYRLGMILKNIPEAMLIISNNGIIELANNSFRSFFGNLTPEKRPVVEIVRNPEFFSLMDSVKESLVPAEIEITIDHPNERHLRVMVSPLFYRTNKVPGFIAVFHDITTQKRLEEVRKDFVANVSHEIKTPVTAIKGFSETLLEGAIDDRGNALRFLNIIRSHSERLNTLVEDLLTLSKIESGVIEINRAEVDLSSVLDAVIETFEKTASEKGLYLRKSLCSANTVITADRDRIMQIMLNLVDNAVKFTEQGGVVIGVNLAGERKTIFVRDTGIGIPERYISRLGERFFRVDPSRSRALGGTGLGLAIVKHLVKAHGFDMEIESREGEGTVVRILL